MQNNTTKEKSAPDNAFTNTRRAHRYEGMAFFDEELDLIDLALKVKKGRLEVYGAPERMKSKPKSDCKKVRYRSRKDAIRGLHKVQAHRDRQMQFGWQFAKLESRVYRCSKCAHGYHLTSKPLNGPRKPAQVIQIRKSLTRQEIAAVVAHVA